jgi:hypothetical protein
MATNNTERMRIDGSGNVGIGTSSPVSGGFLTVGSGAGSSAAVQYLNAGSGGSALLGRISGNNSWFVGDTNAALGSGTGLMNFVYGANPWIVYLNNAERMRIDSSGNLLWGTTSAGATGLTIGSGGAISYTGTGSAQLNNYRATNIEIVSRTAGYGIEFYCGAGSYAGKFDSSGNLLVGTTTSSYTDTNSVVISPSTYSGQINVQHATGSGSGNGFLVFTYATAQIGSISQIGTTGVLYNTSSDTRLKHDIIDAPEASSLIDAIQVRSFKWNADNTEQRYGFVAQELVEVAPEAVSQPTDPDEMMGVDYSKLVPMLVKEIQSLRARVAQLEGS